ncbi:MAG: hypothetical protein R3277_03265 [Brumimicrobium sp.]|nr:hypothetical protein [Brumimicrobium sp.]
MKLLAFVLASTFLLSLNSSDRNEIDILTALEKKLVTVDIKHDDYGLGGDLILKFKPLNKSLQLIIPAGTRFKSHNEEEQDLMNADTKRIILASAKPGAVRVKGFCVQSSNRCPNEESGYTPQKEGDERLVKLARYLDGKSIDHDIKQTSFWAVSDRESVSGIYKEGDKEVEALRKFICTLLSKKDVWYNTDPTYTLDANRNIVYEITKVEGLISYEVAKPGKLRMYVLNGENEVIRSLGEGSQISHLGNYKFNFKLAVKGWERGKYSVQLKIDEEIIHSQEFEIG